MKLVLDKGTWDAIALSENRKQLQEGYIKTVLKVLSESNPHYFLITSCNFTREELVAFFGAHLKAKHQIKYPSFQFGGQEGSTVTSLAFVRK